MCVKEFFGGLFILEMDREGRKYGGWVDSRFSWDGMIWDRIHEYGRAMAMAKKKHRICVFYGVADRHHRIACRSIKCI